MAFAELRPHDQFYSPNHLNLILPSTSNSAERTLYLYPYFKLHCACNRFNQPRTLKLRRDNMGEKTQFLQVCFVSAVPALRHTSCSNRNKISTKRTPWTGVPLRSTLVHIKKNENARASQMSLIPLDQSPMLLSDVSDVNIRSLGVTAFVFFLTFWGGISFVKGSTKRRETQASFTVREPAGDVAKRSARYLMERAFVPDINKDGRKGVVTFTGKVRASSSVASILVAVAASGIWSLTYILNFVLPENLQSPYWGLLSLASLAIVPWYWSQATREEEVKVMVEEDDDGLSTLYIKAHRDEIIELEKAFNWKRNEMEQTGEDVVKAKAREVVANATDSTRSS